MNEATNREIFIGIVAPIGVDYQSAVSVLSDQLAHFGFRTHRLRMSRFLSRVVEVKTAFANEGERIRELMRAGNELRKAIKDGGALACLAIDEIRSIRKKKSGDENKIGENCAYILETLKNPREIEILRDVYGDSFVLVSLYEPRFQRVASLAKRIAGSGSKTDSRPFRADAEEIVKLDEEDGDKLGQRVTDSFADADFFISTARRASTVSAVTRFTEIVFGHPFHTPTVDEYGMFMAWSAALRSADLSRQVGAAICDLDGSVLSVGCNDVPRAGGGQYWPGDLDDRDFQRGYDSSAKEKQRLLTEVVASLGEAGWIVPEKLSLSADEILDELLLREGAALSGAGINSLLEFGRIVHAEMAALSDAARRGIRVQDATLYCTTFPCHMCARHIVASGVRRVVYIEPYPKSRALDLHVDSVTIDSPEPSRKVSFEAFTGIAPRSFGKLFKMNKRKSKSGDALPARGSGLSCRLRGHPAHFLTQEVIASQILSSALEQFTSSEQDTAEGTGETK